MVEPRAHRVELKPSLTEPTQIWSSQTGGRLKFDRSLSGFHTRLLAKANPKLGDINPTPNPTSTLHKIVQIPSTQRPTVVELRPRVKGRSDSRDSVEAVWKGGQESTREGDLGRCLIPRVSSAHGQAWSGDPAQDRGPQDRPQICGAALRTTIAQNRQKLWDECGQTWPGFDQMPAMSTEAGAESGIVLGDGARAPNTPKMYDGG